MSEFLRQRAPIVSMCLRSPQIWWAYLGLRSNPGIVDLINCCDHAIIFDKPSPNLPKRDTTAKKIKYFFVFWDGITDKHQIDEVTSSLEVDADLTVLVVGDYSLAPDGSYRIQPLYPTKSFEFANVPFRFDGRTVLMLGHAKLRNLITPVKNVIRRNGSLSEALGLLFGKKQVVFCGSFGLTRSQVQMLCRRYSADLSLFDEFDWFSDRPDQSLESYRRYLRRTELFFANLFNLSKISSPFLLSVARLLGRQYFLARVRDAGLKVYTNQFAQGSYIDVYSTPFYSQHVFLDFGSVVGTGNYPRLADLKYFSKQTVEIELKSDLKEIFPYMQRQEFEVILNEEWEQKSSQIFRMMHR